MSENNIEDNKQDNSTFIPEDTNYEVKESLLDKIKGILTRPRLGPANNVRTTNMGFTSWSMRSIFRRAMETVSNSVSNLMSKKEPEVRNQFATTIIGKDENTQNKEQTQDKSAGQVANRIIPPIKPRDTVRVAGVQPKGIIDNAKTARDVADEKEGLDVEEITMEEIEIKPKEKEKASTQVNRGIEVGDININDSHGKDSKETRLEDERI